MYFGFKCFCLFKYLSERNRGFQKQITVLGHFRIVKLSNLFNPKREDKTSKTGIGKLNFDFLKFIIVLAELFICTDPQQFPAMTVLLLLPINNLPGDNYYSRMHDTSRELDPSQAFFCNGHFGDLISSLDKANNFL